MDVREIVDAMVGQDVSPQEFLNFFASVGLQHDRLILETHFNLILSDTLGGPDVTWSAEDDQDVLKALRSHYQTSETINQSCSTVEDIIENSHNDEYKSWSPTIMEQVEALSESSLSEPMAAFEEYEPWSPGVQTDAVRHHDMAEASLACLSDGNYRSKKSFFCSRCGTTNEGFWTYRAQLETHAPQSPVAGSSGMPNVSRASPKAPTSLPNV